jgi:type IV secretory pathway TraG/TraD family ATPase VirD4
MGMPIVWQGSDCFTHMLAVGPTRCGKTATILKPMIYQLLLQKKRGIPLGISVVEPKGDVAAMVNEMCLEMGIPCTHVDPDKPDSASVNDKLDSTVFHK